MTDDRPKEIGKYFFIWLSTEVIKFFHLSINFKMLAMEYVLHRQYIQENLSQTSK